MGREEWFAPRRERPSAEQDSGLPQPTLSRRREDPRCNNNDNTSASTCTAAAASSCAAAAEGESLETTTCRQRWTCSAFERAVMAAGERPEVVLEACYGWYWAVDLARGARLQDPSGAPARQQLGAPPREERRPRRRGPGRSAQARATRRGMDRTERGEASSARSCDTGPSSSACAPTASCRPTPCSPKKAWRSR
jgi:hypothetical protein